MLKSIAQCVLCKIEYISVRCIQTLLKPNRLYGTVQKGDHNGPGLFASDNQACIQMIHGRS